MRIRSTSVRLVRLNFGFSMYLDHTFGLTFAEPFRWAETSDLDRSFCPAKGSVNFWPKYLLTSNCNSANWLSECLSQKWSHPLYYDNKPKMHADMHTLLISSNVTSASLCLLTNARNWYFARMKSAFTGLHRNNTQSNMHITISSWQFSIEHPQARNVCRLVQNFPVARILSLQRIKITQTGVRCQWILRELNWHGVTTSEGIQTLGLLPCENAQDRYQ